MPAIADVVSVISFEIAQLPTKCDLLFVEAFCDRKESPL